MGDFARETALHWSAVGLYVVGAVLFTWGTLFQRPAISRWASLVVLAGLLPHGVAIALRWAAVGHGPYMMRYEVLSSNAWLVLALLVAFVLRRPAWAPLAVPVVPLAVLMIAVGLFSSPEARMLPPTLRSVWLVFHVTFAKLAAAAFLMSAATAVLMLLKRRAAPPGWIARLPGLEVLDAFALRFVGFGFVFWTLAVAAGSVWANVSWGRYWGWDPLETWSFVAWVGYGTLLHVKLFFRPGPHGTAWGALGAFAIFVLTALVLPFAFPSFHSAYMQ